MALRATRAGMHTKQQHLKFEQGADAKLGIVGAMRGDTIDDEESFIMNFRKLRGLHALDEATLVGFARTFVRHDCETPMRLKRLIGESGLAAARSLRCERACVAGAIIKHAFQANHHLDKQPDAVELHPGLLEELDDCGPMLARKQTAALEAGAAAAAEAEADVASAAAAAAADVDDLSFGTNDELSVERRNRAEAQSEHGDTAETEEDSVGGSAMENVSAVACDEPEGVDGSDASISSDDGSFKTANEEEVDASGSDDGESQMGVSEVWSGSAVA